MSAFFFLAKKERCYNSPTWRHCQFFWCRRVSLVKFSYWSMFHANIITGSGIKTFFVYNRFDQKSGNWNTSAWVWVLSNIWRLERIRDNKFGVNVPNETLLNTAKCQIYSFCRFWVIKGKARNTSTQIRIKSLPILCFQILFIKNKT